MGIRVAGLKLNSPTKQLSKDHKFHTVIASIDLRIEEGLADDSIPHVFLHPMTNFQLFNTNLKGLS